LRPFLQLFQEFIPELIEVGINHNLIQCQITPLNNLKDNKRTIDYCTSQDPLENIIELIGFSSINLVLSKEELQYSLIKRFLKDKINDKTFLSDIMHKSINDIRLIEKIVPRKTRLMYDILNELSSR